MSVTRTKLQLLHENLKDDIGWALFTMKTLLGENLFRNELLNKLLPKNLNKHIEHTFTFSGEFTNKQLTNKIKSLFKSNNVYDAFTISNKAKIGTDTHYLSFLKDNNRNCLYIFDPAFGVDGADYVVDEELNITINLFLENDYQPVFVYPSYNACQTSFRDGFCQSWSFWMLMNFYKFISDNTNNLRLLKKPGFNRKLKCPKSYKFSAYNFFKTTRFINENDRILYLNNELYQPILDIIQKKKSKIITTGNIHDLDLELNYVNIRSQYDGFIYVDKKTYNTFFNSKFGKGLKSYGIHKSKKNLKIPKSIPTITNEAYQLLRIAGSEDFY